MNWLGMFLIICAIFGYWCKIKVDLKLQVLDIFLFIIDDLWKILLYYNIFLIIITSDYEYN